MFSFLSFVLSSFLFFSDTINLVFIPGSCRVDFHKKLPHIIVKNVKKKVLVIYRTDKYPQNGSRRLPIFLGTSCDLSVVQDLPKGIFDWLGKENHLDKS